MTDKTITIRERFEQALVDGLQGQPLVTKEGPVLDKEGQVILGPPEASFLSVVRAYLKDLTPDEKAKPKTPQTGEARGALKDFMEGKGTGLPFGGSRPQ